MNVNQFTITQNFALFAWCHKEQSQVVQTSIPYDRPLKNHYMKVNLSRFAENNAFLLLFITCLLLKGFVR